MIERIIRAIYVTVKLSVMVAGLYIILSPPFNLIGTLSSSVMVLAALLSVYAILTNKPSIEFISIWFVCVGLGAYAGLTWVSFDLGAATFSRGITATMPFLLLVARGLTLWRLVLEINSVEKRVARDNE